MNHDKTSFEMSTANSPTLRVFASKLCRKHAISDATFYTWRKKYGGMGCPRLFYEDEIDIVVVTINELSPKRWQRIVVMLP